MGQYTAKDNASQVAAGVFVGPIDLPKDRMCSIGVQTGAANAANAAVQLEGSFDGVTFFILAAIDPTDAATVKTSYVGVTKAGVVPLNGGSLRQVQLRRTDANGGVCTAILSITAWG